MKTMKVKHRGANTFWSRCASWKLTKIPNFKKATPFKDINIEMFRNEVNLACLIILSAPH